MMMNLKQLRNERDMLLKLENKRRLLQKKDDLINKEAMQLKREIAELKRRNTKTTGFLSKLNKAKNNPRTRKALDVAKGIGSRLQSSDNLAELLFGKSKKKR